MINSKILIVDDEPDICNLVSDILSDSGYIVKKAFSKNDAIKVMENSGISLVITDIWMNNNEMEGFELLEWCKSFNALTPVLIMSGHGTIEYAMNAAKNGAYDFLEKPFNSERLLFLVKKALQERDLKIKLMDSNNEWLKSNQIIGKSSEIKNIKNINNYILETESLKNSLKKIQLDLKNKHNGRLLVRPSGTEPIVRILVECEYNDQIDQYISKVQDLLVKENSSQ